MPDARITLTGLWVALMLTYLLGDVLRIFAGHYVAGEMQGRQLTQGMWLGIAALMLIPIVMVVLTLTLPYSAARWASVVVGGFWVLFGLASLPYEGHYDNFLIGVSLVFCGLIIWYAWTWEVAA
jgi:hypothetical protein